MARWIFCYSLATLSTVALRDENAREKSEPFRERHPVPGGLCMTPWGCRPTTRARLHARPTSRELLVHSRRSAWFGCRTAHPPHARVGSRIATLRGRIEIAR